MSTIQPDLHNFFKVKKHTKETGSKDGKIKSDIVQIQKKTSRPNSRSSSPCPTVHSSKKNLFIKKESESYNNEVLPKKKIEVPINSTKVDKDEPTVSVNTTETNKNESILPVNTTETDKKESILITTPTKIGLDDVEDEAPSRKRKRQQLEEENLNFLSQTPPGGENVLPSALMSPKKQKIELPDTPTARKRLILGEQKQPPLGKLNPEAVKKELSKCGRLDELRARLLKMNQCEQKLQAFRSQTWKKEEEKVTLSPKKSTRKDLTKSPYKLSSPNKLLPSSPHKSSPRKLSPYPLSSPKKFSSPLKLASQKANANLPSPLKGLRLNHFSSLDIEVPLSPSKSPAKACTPVKSCYERFSHLAAPSSSGQLVLPHKYQLIKEVFRAVDTVISLLHNRQEVITFSKLRPAVQEMLRKTFSEKHLGQLKSVFPLAYFFAQEKMKSKKSSSYNVVSYELTVKPNFEYKKVPARNIMQEFDDTPCATASVKYRKMDSVVLVERRHLFHAALLDVLKKHHQEFLQSLTPPIMLDGPVRRWHPEFPIEDVSPVPSSPLPQKPAGQDAGPDTAKDVLERARDVFSVNTRMKEAVQSAVDAAAAKDSAVIPPVSQKSSVQEVADKKSVVTALKGVSLSLLEKIRAREAEKASREMTRSVVASKELQMLSQLPELVRVLRSVFVTEKKAALPWDGVVGKVVASHSGSLSVGETKNLLDLLMKEVPGWCVSHKVRSGLYLKIDKSRQLHEITDTLAAIIKQRT